MGIREWLERQPKKFHIIAAFLFTMALGYIDYLTGFELRMEIFYLLPISYVTWFVGEKTGITFAIISLVTVVGADIKAGKHFAHLFVELWNALMYLVFYTCVALLLRFRKTVRQRESLIEDLEDALRVNEELSGLLPVCSRCEKYRDDEEYRRKVASYIRSHGDGDFSRGLCKECSAELHPENRS